MQRQKLSALQVQLALYVWMYACSIYRYFSYQMEPHSFTLPVKQLQSTQQCLGTGAYHTASHFFTFGCKFFTDVDMQYHDDDYTLHRLPKPAALTTEYTDVVLCFDTTGSMADWILQLRIDLCQLVTNIFDKYSNVMIGVSFLDYKSLKYKKLHLFGFNCYKQHLYTGYSAVCYISLDSFI